MSKGKNVKKDLTRIFVVDLEATCWEEGKPPEGEHSEIIEIGVCLFNTIKWEPAESFTMIIKPTFSKISQYCTDLTGHTQASIDKNGITFGRACKLLKREYGTRRRIWASWGAYDRIHFERQCEKMAIEYPWGNDHWNLKDMFAISRGMKRGVGLKKAVSLVGLEFEGPQHRGMVDAYNTARVLQKMHIVTHRG